MNLYNKKYFDKLFISTYDAAKIVLKRLHKIYPFKSMIDIGCGHGSWLRAAHELSAVQKITGVDGFYTKEIHQDFLKFPKINFIYKNLEDKFLLDGLNKYDLALSLETAEHLSPKRAKGFINDLCNISDVIFFSAAVDGHGGQNHLNENHQSYWIKLFKYQKYDPFIVIDRKKYWFHEAFKKCPYYISGAFLFIKNNTKVYANLIKYKVNENQVVDIVHPYILQWRKDENFGVKMNFRRLMKSLIKFFRKNLNF